MHHRQFVRIVDDSDTSVLMIHGIVGTPDHFDDMIPLIPPSWSVENLLLDGHGKRVEDFAASSMAKWKAQVSGCLSEMLDRNQRILLVGHSMGTLFAIQSAIAYQNAVAGLFLMNVPLRPFIRPAAAAASVRLALGTAGPDDKIAAEMSKDCSIQLDRHLWKYLHWVPRYAELLREIRQTRKILPRLRTPCMAFQSGRDELVSAAACRDLSQSRCVEMYILPNSGHFCYCGEDRERLLEKFREMVTRLGSFSQ